YVEVWRAQLLELLDLSPSIDTRVRHLSGGQRRRLAIGIELISLPSVLFLDEPTSGLDATAAMELMQSLPRFVQAGCTIVAVLHQPSTRLLLSHVQHILLMRFPPLPTDGDTPQVMFYGSLSRAISLATIFLHTPTTVAAAVDQRKKKNKMR